MKSEKIKNELVALENKLRALVGKIGVVEFARRTGIDYTDISCWQAKKRNWSYKKLLKAAGKLEV